MKTLAIFSALLAQLATAHAAPGQPDNTGPFAGNPAPKTTLQRTIVNWLDNLTVGALQTTLGAGHFVVSMIANPIRGAEFPTPSLPESNHGQQIVVKDSVALNGVGYSLGLFNVGPVSGSVPWHEAGHSQQSAVLGPMYLPTVLLDYLVEATAGNCFPYSCGNEFIERWADLEAESYDAMSFTTSARIGAGFIRRNDVALPVLVLDFTLDERFDAVDKNTRVQKFYEWLKTEIAIPLAATQGRLPLFFEINALQKTETVDVRLAPGFNLRIKSEQAYARATYAPGLGALRFDALEWAPAIGLSADFQSPVQVFATAGGSVSLTSVLTLDDDAVVHASTPLTAGVGARVVAGVTLWDFASIYGAFTKEWVLSSYSRTSWEGGVTNAYRSPHNAIPRLLNYFDLGAKIVHETIELPGPLSKQSTIESFFLTVGGRL